jgi:iron complex transport system ATP-binding protein
VPGPDRLVLDAVTAGYDRRVALRDATITVAAGEVVGLIGPNGSGKTTAVRVASRALRPSRGAVRLDGLDPYRLGSREAARLVAVVPQDVPITFEFTALEVVLMGRSPYLTPLGTGADQDYRRVGVAMERAGVEDLAHRPLGELSGGEKQRVILAQALAQDAGILVLDEPTTHLDLRHVVAILDAVRDLARRGAAVLAVFHDLNLAASWCDRLLALHQGRVAAAGRPDDVLTPSFLRSVYEVEADVSFDQATGRPTVMLTRPEERIPRA